MDRRQMMLGAGAAALGLRLAKFPVGWTADVASPRRNILFFTKSSGFQHSVITRQGDELSHAEKIMTELGKQHNFDVACTKDGTVFNPENIAKYDLFFFYTTGVLTEAGTDKQPPMTKEGKAALLAAVHDGKGFAGSHCASDTFHNPDVKTFSLGGDKVDPYIAMLGGEFISHGAQQKANMIVTDQKFPGFGELSKSFNLEEEWYSLKDFAKDMHALLLQETQGMTGDVYDRPNYPATWARKHGRGRVFYTSMGHREDVWTNPVFQGVLLGGLAWAAGNVEADVSPNLESLGVDPNSLPKKKS